MQKVVTNSGDYDETVVYLYERVGCARPDIGRVNDIPSGKARLTLFGLSISPVGA